MNKTQTIRPTKKQRELLTYIQGFIKQHGYSPSYREIMNGCAYNSVATVAVHINNLISRGHLRKRDNSARSLEVVGHDDQDYVDPNAKSPEETWLVNKVEDVFRKIEGLDHIQDDMLSELYVLAGALKVLQFQESADKFVERLAVLKNQTAKTKTA